MSQLRAREVDELTDYDETFKRRLVDLHWLMYFFEDGQPMVIYANFSGIQASLAGRALAKVGDIFKVTIKGSVYTGRNKAIGMKSLMEKYLGLLSQAIKNSSGEPELDFPCSSSSRDSTLSEKRRSRVLESDDETDGEDGNRYFVPSQEGTSIQRCHKSSSITPLSKAKKALTPQDVNLWQLRATPKAASDNGAETLIEAVNNLSKVVSNLDNSVKRLETEIGGVISRLDNSVRTLDKSLGTLTNRSVPESSKFSAAIKSLVGTFPNIDLRRDEETVSVQKLGISGPLLEEPSDEQPRVFFGDVNLVALKPNRPTVSEYSRLLMRTMYMDEEVKTHMLSPDKGKASARPDFSPTRKRLFKDAIKAKYGDRWPTAYEEGKKSVNKMGPELTYGSSRQRNRKSQLDVNDENCEATPE